MSTPTPGSDPNFAQGGAPQGQPGWDAPQQQGYTPAPSYSGAPAGYGAPATGRPPQVLTAAILGFVVAFFLLLGGLLFFAASTLLGGIAAVFGILYLALAALSIVGGVQAIQGKSSVLLKIAGGITAGLSLLAIISYLVQGDFDFSSLVSLVIGAAIVFLLVQPVSKQYFASRGAK